jgi:hypothetical protein
MRTEQIDLEMKRAAKEKIKQLITTNLLTIQETSSEIQKKLKSDVFYKSTEFISDMNQIRLKMENIESLISYFEVNYKPIANNFQVN